jgi:predicted transcriptional regulator
MIAIILLSTLVIGNVSGATNYALDSNQTTINYSLESINTLTYSQAVYLTYRNGTPVFYVNEEKEYIVKPVKVLAINMTKLVLELGYRVDDRDYDLVVSDRIVETDKKAIFFAPIEGFKPLNKRTKIVWIKDPLKLKETEVFGLYEFPERGEVIARYENGGVAITKIGDKIYVGVKPDKAVLANTMYVHTVEKVEPIPTVVVVTITVTAVGFSVYGLYSLLKKFLHEILSALFSLVIAIGGYINLMNKDEVLLNDTRRDIYNYILDNPGCHLREIQKEMGVSISTATWHLRILEKAGLIRVVKHRNKLLYYPTGFKLEDALVATTLKNATAKAIVDYLLRVGNAHVRKIARDLDLGVETVRYNLKKLERVGVVLNVEEGNKVVYYINPEVVFIVKNT